MIIVYGPCAFMKNTLLIWISGCITSAETVMLEKQSLNEFLSHTGSEKAVILSLSPQSRASLASYFDLTPTQMGSRRKRKDEMLTIKPTVESRGTTIKTRRRKKKVLALPLPHRPLFPGFYVPIYIKFSDFSDSKLKFSRHLTSVLHFTAGHVTSYKEPFFGIGADVLPPRKVGAPLADNIEFGRQCLATMQTPNDNYLILCGNWENSFQVISLADGKMVQSIRQHKDLVSCVAVTSDGSTIATGSFDTTVMVWKAYRGRSTDKRSRNLQSELLRKDRVIIESPFHILCGHDDIVTCLFISLELDIVISGSKDGTCVFHTLREGRYVRSIRHPSGCSISKLVVSKHGRMVVYADDDLSLHMYSINGKHVASSESNGRLNCIELSRCGDFLVCAGDHGQIVVRSMHSLDVVKRYEGVGRIITSLTVTPEECFLVGTKDGSILLYCIENPQLRKGSLPRNSKSKSSAAG